LTSRAGRGDIKPTRRLKVGVWGFRDVRVFAEGSAARGVRGMVGNIRGGAAGDDGDAEGDRDERSESWRVREWS
jgi:hypothetical protein